MPISRKGTPARRDKPYTRPATPETPALPTKPVKRKRFTPEQIAAQRKQQKKYSRIVVGGASPKPAKPIPPMPPERPGPGPGKPFVKKPKTK
jgi:hypothetical protein